MVGTWRVRRQAELRALSNTEPERLIALYRFVTGMVICTEPPRCTSFTTMIETILDHDEKLSAAAMLTSNDQDCGTQPAPDWFSGGSIP
jgi:hypothetical protein